VVANNIRFREELSIPVKRLINNYGGRRATLGHILYSFNISTGVL